jgi:hypothetical protein
MCSASRFKATDILQKVLRRSVALILIAAIATLQCVSWADVDNARQTTRDGRSIVAAAGGHGGVGAARMRGTASFLLSGAVIHTFVFGPPAVSSIKGQAEASARICASLVETPSAPRPPPALG